MSSSALRAGLPHRGPLHDRPARPSDVGRQEAERRGDSAGEDDDDDEAETAREAGSDLNAEDRRLVTPEWADKYKRKFDDGWDELRERTFARQKELGVIPADSDLTPRHKEIPAWDEMP